jgi:hypothetical protein
VRAGSRKVMEVLNTKTELLTKRVERIICYDDLCIDGMNAIHLAAKFDPKSLEVSFLKYFDSFEDILFFVNCNFNSNYANYARVLRSF